MAKELTIRLGEKDQTITVDALAAALENTLKMLRNLERHFTSDSESIRWEIIRAGMQSPLTITIVPRSVKGQTQKRVGDKVVKAYVDGLKTLEREPQLPPHFDEDTLEAAKRLAEAATTEGTSLKIFAPNGDEIALDRRAVVNAQEIAAKARTYIDYGTIEGKLELLSTHKGDSFAVWEPVTGHKVECRVDPEQSEQFERAKELLRHRVAITGRIRYRNGKPQTVDVETIRALREQAELPQPTDIGPIDITGGTDSEDYIRRLRDAR